MQATKSTFKNADYMIDTPKIIKPKFFEEDNRKNFSKALSSIIQDQQEEMKNSKYAQKIWRDGHRYRIMFKTIYYKGASYQVEEEVKIDSDEESSVHTSEDEFV
jgi:hypothetical protein